MVDGEDGDAVEMATPSTIEEKARAEEEEKTEQQQELNHESQRSQAMAFLTSLRESSQVLQPSIQALMELETEPDLLKNDPNLPIHLDRLKSLLQHRLHRPPDKISTFRSFFHRRSSSDHEISRFAGSVEAEVRAWIDCYIVDRLVYSLGAGGGGREEEKVRLLGAFESRISEGFDRDLQDIVLRSKVFEAIESTLCDPAGSRRVREKAALAVAELVRFNKDVFVGQVLMGRTVHALLTMATAPSIQVVAGLVRSIKSPLVDDIHTNGEIPKIVHLLSAEDADTRLAAADLVMSMGYFGRKEAVEAMLEEGLLGKLMELQRSEGGGSLVEKGGERHPFASCVARFAIQMEVGAGLRRREKRKLKQEVLQRVREAEGEAAELSEAEAATMLAEVLWGPSH